MFFNTKLLILLKFMERKKKVGQIDITAENKGVPLWF